MHSQTGGRIPLESIDEEELNLIYVAMTRAEQNLKLNDKTKEWLYDINKMSYLLNIDKKPSI